MYEVQCASDSYSERTDRPDDAIALCIFHSRANPNHVVNVYQAVRTVSRAQVFSCFTSDPVPPEV